MPVLKLNSEGNLVDEQNNPILIDGEVVSVKDVMTKEQTEATIKARLDRQKEKIQNLERQANRTPELDRELNIAKEELSSMKEAMEKAQQAAEEKVRNQLQTIKSEREELAKELEKERTVRKREALSRNILELARDKFINPNQDVIPHLLARHRAEPALDDNGKPIKDEVLDLFEVNVRTKDGKIKKETLPLKEAIEAYADDPDNLHYLKPSSHQGPGNRQFTNEPEMTSISKRSELRSNAQKSKFISEFGLEAFKALPE